MTLRTRLLLGYALLVLLLVATGAAGSYEFHEISTLVSERLDHFTATTKSANVLLRTVERQDRLLLHSIIAADAEPYEAALAATHDEFAEALSLAETLADAEQERLLASIRDADGDFVAARDVVARAHATSSTAAPTAYETTFVPALQRLREPCERLFAGSRQHMFDARDAVRDAATSGSVLLGVLVTFGLLLLIGLARSMRTHVLERLDELRRFSEAIAAGDEQQRALLTGNDELARLAYQMNSMLDRQGALEGRLEGRLAQDRLMLVAMLGAFNDRAILLSTGGDLISWSGDIPSPAIVDELATRAALRNLELSRGAAPPDEPLDWCAPDGSAWHVHALRAGAGRAAGWLAYPVRDTA